MQAVEKITTLPEVREDLQIMEGTRHHSGARGWVIFDPVRHQYFQIGTTAVHMLGLWQLGAPAAIAQVLAEQGIVVDEADFEALIVFLQTNYLTIQPIDNDFRRYSNHAQSTEKKWWEYAVHRYLFFRAPLFRPYRFLAKTYPSLAFMYSVPWLVFVLAIAVLGAYLTARQWDVYTQTFMRFFNTDGIAYYVASLIVVKAIHELGHAYTATRYGCRVTSIGLAFLVMFPVLYTDTTDSWRVPARKQRLAIDAAGVGAELMLAVFTTFLWAFLPDGIARSIAFFIATTSWLLSVTVNVNPFLRFDGYYFLSDLIGVQNLQDRSFAMGKWSLREKLFGWRVPAPEVMSVRRARALIVYAWGTWLYRFFLFLGIALLVYAFFFKALGVVLFAVEIFWFILRPIYKEFQVWFSMHRDASSSSRSWATFACLGTLLMMCIIPWNSTLRIPAIAEASDHTRVFPHQAGRVTAVHLRNGDLVAKGDVLVELTSPSIEFQLHQTQRRIQILSKRIGRIAADARDRDDLVVLRRELLREKGRHVGLLAELAKLNIRAPITGRVTDWDDSLHVDRWINSDAQVAVVESNSGIRIRGFVESDDVHRISKDSAAKFVPENHQLGKLNGKVTDVSQANAELISIASLTSRFGGAIAVSESEEQLKPMGTWYSVIVDLKDVPAFSNQVQRGVIFLRGSRESFAQRVWRQIMRVLVRESSL